jgi:Domain of unknown function (DUF5655)
MDKPKYSVDDHFAGKEHRVRAIYDRLLRTAERFGNVSVEPKKTSIHLVNRTAFAGIATRKDAIILTLKSADDVDSPRFFKRLQASKHRWYLETRLDREQQVDKELSGWLRRSFALASGSKS